MFITKLKLHLSTIQGLWVLICEWIRACNVWFTEQLTKHANAMQLLQAVLCCAHWIFSFKKTSNLGLPYCTPMAQSQKTGHNGVSPSSKGRPPSTQTVAPVRSQPPAWQWWRKQYVTPVFPWIAWRDGIHQAAHGIFIVESMTWLQKCKRGMRGPHWQGSMFLSLFQMGVKGNDRADRLTGKEAILWGLIASP